MSGVIGHRGLMLAAGGSADPTALSIFNKLTSWWEMNEASGTRSDSKGTNHLAVGGTVSTATGVRGGADVAASFAAGGWLHAVDSASLSVPSGGGDHCLFGWFYITSGNGFFAGKWDASGPSAYEYGMQVSGGTVYGQNGGGGYVSATQASPGTGSWHFGILWRDSAAGTDAGKVRLEIDNGTVNLSASASSPSDTINELGFATAAGSGGSSLLTGRLQRWGWIKGNLLTPTERTWLYNSGAGRTWAELYAAAGSP